MDLVDWDGQVFDRIGKAYAELAQTLGIANFHLVPISALKGDNVVEPSRNTPWYDGPPLLSLLETLPVAATPVSPSPRFFVQWVIRHGGSQVDRKSVVKGKSVSVRVDLGGRRIVKKKKNNNTQRI